MKGPFSMLFSVRLRVTGLNVEKLINEARKRRMTLHRARREENRTLTVDLSPRDSRAFRELAREMGYETSAAEPQGALRLFERLKRRIWIGAGVLAGMALVIWSLGCVWKISVENAGPYEGEVRLYLEENGIKPGIRRNSIDLQALREGLEWRLPKIKWVRTAWAGTALILRIEEGTPPPEKEDVQASDIVASEDGLLKRLTVYAGTPQARPGDLVRKGQVLIRGEERGANGALVPVRARGEAAASVWITVRLRVPAVEYVSVPAGRRQERRVIETPVGNYCAQEEDAYLICETDRANLPLAGVWIPVNLTREVRTEIWLEKQERDMELVCGEGEAAAWEALGKAAYPHEIVDKWINFSMIEGDNIIVTATAEIEKEIGRGQARNIP